jgi:hypothetical protein
VHIYRHSLQWRLLQHCTSKPPKTDESTNTEMVEPSLLLKGTNIDWTLHILQHEDGCKITVTLHMRCAQTTAQGHMHTVDRVHTCDMYMLQLAGLPLS